MRRSRLLIGLFLLATVLVDAAALLAARIDTVFFPNSFWSNVLSPHLSRVDATSVFLSLLLALYFTQVSLTAIWLAIGRTAAPRRTAVACFLLLGWIAALSLPIEPPGNNLSVTLFITAVAAASVSLPLLAAGPLGLRLGTPELASLGPQRFQFSIAYLLGLTTATAVTLSLINCVAAYGWLPSYDRATNYEVIALGAGRGLVAPFALWAALGNRWIVVRLIAFVLAASAAYGSLFLYDGLFDPAPHTYLTHDFIRFSGLLFSLEAVLLLASLWVFRLAGYRVVFRRSTLVSGGTNR